MVLILPLGGQRRPRKARWSGGRAPQGLSLSPVSGYGDAEPGSLYPDGRLGLSDASATGCKLPVRAG
jgi:hypothetical protein